MNMKINKNRPILFTVNIKNFVAVEKGKIIKNTAQLETHGFPKLVLKISIIIQILSST